MSGLRVKVIISETGSWQCLFEVIFSVGGSVSSREILLVFTVKVCGSRMDSSETFNLLLWFLL